MKGNKHKSSLSLSLFAIKVSFSKGHPCGILGAAAKGLFTHAHPTLRFSWWSMARLNMQAEQPLQGFLLFKAEMKMCMVILELWRPVHDHIWNSPGKGGKRHGCESVTKWWKWEGCSPMSPEFQTKVFFFTLSSTWDTLTGDVGIEPGTFYMPCMFSITELQPFCKNPSACSDLGFANRTEI